LVGKSKGRSVFGRRRSKWEANVKKGVKEIGWESVNRINSAQDTDQVACSCEQGRGTPGSLGCGKFPDWLKDCAIPQARLNSMDLVSYGKVKGKVFPLQARYGPRGGYRYSFTLPWPRH